MAQSVGHQTTTQKGKSSNPGICLLQDVRNFKSADRYRIIQFPPIYTWHSVETGKKIFVDFGAKSNVISPSKKKSILHGWRSHKSYIIFSVHDFWLSCVSIDVLVVWIFKQRSLNILYGIFTVDISQSKLSTNN